jgi:hypothetical protein
MTLALKDRGEQEEDEPHRNDRDNEIESKHIMMNYTYGAKGS